MSRVNPLCAPSHQKLSLEARGLHWVLSQKPFSGIDSFCREYSAQIEDINRVIQELIQKGYLLAAHPNQEEVLPCLSYRGECYYLAKKTLLNERIKEKVK